MEHEEHRIKRRKKTYSIFIIGLIYKHVESVFSFSSLATIFYSLSNFPLLSVLVLYFLLLLAIVVFNFFFFSEIESVCCVFISLCTFSVVFLSVISFVIQHTEYLSFEIMQIFWWVCKQKLDGFVSYTTKFLNVFFRLFLYTLVRVNVSIFLASKANIIFIISLEVNKLHALTKLSEIIWRFDGSCVGVCSHLHRNRFVFVCQIIGARSICLPVYIE